MSRAEAVGFLAMFWHLSRGIRDEKLTRAHIVSCIIIPSMEQAIDGLMHAGYLVCEPEDHGLFTVIDNAPWHKRAQRLRAVAIRGGKSRGKRTRAPARPKKKSPAEALAQATAEANALADQRASRLRLELSKLSRDGEPQQQLG